MIASQTGFGRAEVEDAPLKLSVEIRSVNSRFLEMNIRTPRSLSAYEPEIRNLVKSKLDRGKVLVHINETREVGANAFYRIDREALNVFVGGIRDLGKASGLEDDLKLSDLLGLLDQMAPAENEEINEKRQALALRGIREALDDFLRVSREEGANLAKDLAERLQVIAERVEAIAARAEENRNELLDRLKERLEKYIPAEQLDPGRLEQEVVFMVDRIDITEEVVRMRSHVEQFHDTIRQGNAVGKRLNFLLQEMNREINTMGSKAAAPEISGWVVDCKEELEKMREQVQNLV